MANKFIKHYYDDYGCRPQENNTLIEPDKNKTISELSLTEVRRMIDRLQGERELESLVRDLKRNSGQRDTFETPFVIDANTPINQLYHFGIIGQKWGIRRYQHEDGTRTSAGKKREEDGLTTKSEDHTISRESKKRATEGLSNDELKKLNERLQLETTYKNLTAEKIQKSESFIKRAMAAGGEQAATEFAKGIFLGGAKLLVKEISPQFAETAFNLKEKKKT